MTKLNPKTIGVGVVFLLLVGYLAFTALTGSDPVAKLTGASEGEAAAVTEQSERVPTVITDPFFHPSIQEVQPNNLPEGAVSAAAPTPPPMTGPVPSGNAPLRPQAPNINDPYGGNAPIQPMIQALPGTLPAQMPSQPPVQNPTPNQTVSQPELTIKVQVQGLVVGSQPAAFVRINDGSSLKVTAGSKLEGGIVVKEISEQTVTFSRDGKKVAIRPGHAENL